MKVYKRSYRCRKTGELRQTKTWHLEYQERGRRRRISLGVRDKGIAEIRAAEILRGVELEKAGIQTFGSTTCRPPGDLVEEYCKELVRLARYESHVRLTRSRLEWLLSGASRIDQLTPAWFRRKLCDLVVHEGRSGRTANAYRTAAHGFFSWLVREGRWGSNPVDQVSQVREGEPSRKRRVLSRAETARLLSSAPPHRSLVYLLAVTTGLRRGELAALRVRDVDLDTAAIRVRASTAKNRKYEEIPLPPSTLAALGRAISDKEPDEPALPPVPDVRTLYGDLARAGIPREVGGRVLDFHALRVTFGTELSRQGVSLPMTQKLMRHNKPELTSNLYTRFELEERREAVGRIDPLPPPSFEEPLEAA